MPSLAPSWLRRRPMLNRLVHGGQQQQYSNNDKFGFIFTNWWFHLYNETHKKQYLSNYAFLDALAVLERVQLQTTDYWIVWNVEYYETTGKAERHKKQTSCKQTLSPDHTQNKLTAYNFLTIVHAVHRFKSNCHSHNLTRLNDNGYMKVIEWCSSTPVDD